MQSFGFWITASVAVFQLTGLSSFAQSSGSSPQKKQTTPQRKVVPTQAETVQTELTPREMYLQKAKADQAEYDAKFQNMIRDNGSYTPCEVEKARVLRDYATWYVQNEAEVWKKIDQFKADAKMMQDASFIDQKFKDLLNAQVEAVQSSSLAKTAIKFMDLVNHVSDLSIKKRKSIDQNELDVFKAQAMDPVYSPYQIGLTQVIETLKVMAANMNATLLERGVSFELVFEDRDLDYFLGLVVKYESQSKEVRIDLLSRESRTSVLDGIALSAIHNQPLADGSLVDARLRYAATFSKSPLKRCLPRIKALASMQPYLTVAELGSMQRKTRNFYQLILEGGSVYCEMGTTGEISFANKRSRILSWGGPVTMPYERVGFGQTSRIEIMWSGAYGSIWIDFDQEDEEGRFRSSHGPATCR